MRTSKLLALALIATLGTSAKATNDEIANDTTLRDVVVTGTRTAVPERAIISTVSTVNSEQLNQLERVSLLPTLSEQIPNLFITQRGLMGYGVSGGAASDPFVLASVTDQ